MTQLLSLRLLATNREKNMAMDMMIVILALSVATAALVSLLQVKL